MKRVVASEVSCRSPVTYHPSPLPACLPLFQSSIVAADRFCRCFPKLLYQAHGSEATDDLITLVIIDAAPSVPVDFASRKRATEATGPAGPRGEMSARADGALSLFTSGGDDVAEQMDDRRAD